MRGRLHGRVLGVTPDEAWEALGLGGHPFDDSPLDYTDGDQKSKAVVIDGERWAVLVLRRPA